MRWCATPPIVKNCANWASRLSWAIWMIAPVCEGSRVWPTRSCTLRRRRPVAQLIAGRVICSAPCHKKPALNVWCISDCATRRRRRKVKDHVGQTREPSQTGAIIQIAHDRRDAQFAQFFTIGGVAHQRIHAIALNQ